MNNNYVFQRLLATFDLSRNHDLTAKVFELGGQRSEVSKSLVKSWRTHDINSKHYKPMRDDTLKIFLDGIQQASKDGLITIYLSEVGDD
jgi:uncharacterized protein YehS (DUF1456 family)